MTFSEYVIDCAPGRCGVSKAFGVIVKLIIDAEKAGEPAFKAENFESTRNRAELAAPYPGGAEREHVLDVVELAMCSHRQAVHGEDHAERIAFLKTRPMSTAEYEMAVRDWWNE